MGNSHDFIFEGVVTNFAETGGNDAQALNAFFAGFQNNLWHDLSGNGNDSGVNNIRHSLDVRIALISHDFFGFEVDRVNGALIAAVFEVFNDFVTDLFGVD